MPLDHESDIINVSEPQGTIPTTLPVLPLRDVVVFPYMIFPVLVGRESSLRAVNEALERNKYIFLAAQRSSVTEDPGMDDIHHEGTVAKIVQILKLPNGLMKILVDGIVQASISRVLLNEKFLEAEIALSGPAGTMDSELDALLRHTSTLFAEYVHLNRNVPSEVLVAFENTKDPRRRMYYIASNILQGVEVKQKLLELTTMRDQLHELIRILNSENDVLKIEKEIDTKVHDNIARSQRKFFIQEQIRILQDELGDEDASPEAAKLREDIQRAKMTKEAEEKAMEELAKLKKTSPLSPESTVIRSYLDWMVAVPWHKRTKDNLDIAHVQTILDEDHFGLEAEGQDSRAYRGAEPRPGNEGADPLLRRSAGRGEDIAGEVDRPRTWSEARADFTGRRAGRSGDPRPPPHLYWIHARKDHPVHEARRRGKPGDHPG